MYAFVRLFERHDPAMVLTAVGIGLAAALCVFRLRSRMRHSRGMVRLAWVFLCGAVTAAGGWSAELAGLSAFHMGAPAGYDPAGVLGALLLAVVGSVGAVALAWMGRDRLRVCAGGILLALTALVMHLVAVASYRVTAELSWSPILVWLGVVVAAAAYVTALLGAGSARRFSQQAFGALFLAIGSAGLHFISLVGLEIRPDPALVHPGGLIDVGVMTFIGVTLAIMTILGGLGAAYIDDVSSRSALQRTRRLADAAREGIVVLSGSGRIVDCNAAFCAMAGATAAELTGQAFAPFLALEGGGAMEPERACEARLTGPGGEAVPVEVLARPLQEATTESEPTTVMSLRDLRGLRQAQDHIRFLAEHDPLTGLPNRELMTRNLRARFQEGVTLGFIRIANSSEINSLYGHAAGDAVVVKTAERLRRLAAAPLPGFDCEAARVGGSELAFVVFGRPDEGEGEAFLRTLAKMVRRPVRFDTHMVEPNVCIGLAAAPLDSHTVEDLVRHAEVALESASRGDSVEGAVYFRQDLQDELVAQRTLIRDLKAGLAENQLVVHYQPQARTVDGRLCGFEALVRWVHPEHGFMPPDSFIPVAEKSGLILDLGEQVLRRACAEAAGWSHPVPVAVNLSPLQVGQAELPRLVHEVLMETGLPPARLELEITESALFGEYQRALDTLRRLKALGVRISMDDFGTGFSSLSTLQSFPFDKIKIDKSFVNGMGSLARSTVIVKAVLGIGKGLDIPVVAEGVETAEQMALLRDEGCAVVQGYHIGKPGPIALHADMFAALDRPEPRLRSKPEPRAEARVEAGAQPRAGRRPRVVAAG